jgi:hypothetical protein
MAMAEVAPKIKTLDGKDGARSGKRRYSLPKSGTEAGIDVAREFPPLRVERLELPRGHARVLSRVYFAVVLQGDAGQAIEEGETDLLSDGKIER